MENSKIDFDIFIVGAGPGGSIAGKVAAENGYKTCIIEKDVIGEKGRYKACGGAIAWELVEEIDYPEDKISRIFESLELHHVDGDRFSKKGRGATIWRNKFYSGPNHPFWTGGEDAYRRILLGTKIPVRCVKCGYKNERVLVVHHKDGNRKNNKLKNLEWLCRNCHYLVHKMNTI